MKNCYQGLLLRIATCIFALLGTSRSLVCPHRPRPKGRAIFAIEADSNDRKREGQEQQLPLLQLKEYFVAPSFDVSLIGWTMLGQGLILNLAFLSNLISGGRPIFDTTFSFDSASMNQALLVAAPLAVSGFALDQLPFEPFKQISRDTKFFVLRLLGRSSPPVSSMALSALLAATAGFSEELFFRGFVFSSLEESWGPIIALLLSSAIFGLAHFPVWGANALVEAVLGGAFGYAYIISDHNLAVPIAAHTFYDFVTIFITWLVASGDLNKRILLAGDQDFSGAIKANKSVFDPFSRAVFDLLDINGDGFIDEKEFSLGLRFLGYSDHPLAARRVGSPPAAGPGSGFNQRAKTLFIKTDKNGDGYIDFAEFADFLQTDAELWKAATLKMQVKK